MELDKTDPSINAHLANIMQEGTKEKGAEDEKEQHLPVKSKQKTSFAKVTAFKPTNPKAKNLQMSIGTHCYKHPRGIVEA
jgi:hypothetical protein